MAGFVQIVEFRSSRFEELKKLSEEYEDTGAARALTHGVVTRDREDPNLFRTIVEFPSYEAAMENSARPQTGEFANRMAGLCDGPPRFANLDVIHTMESSMVT